MVTATCPSKVTLFFECLSNSTDLDERDNRGKKHSLALVLTGLVLALCCGRDGKLSGLHRHMVHHFPALQQATAMNRHWVISRAQLPRVLAKVNGVVFAELLREWFGLSLSSHQRGWFSVDGKELRGSIAVSHRRGEACVSALNHDTGQIISQLYYSGTKDSEQPAVRQLLTESGLAGQKLTLDALHMTPETLTLIQQQGGSFLVGLKRNQSVLYRYAVCHTLMQLPVYQRQDAVECGHGRREQRHYECFGVNSIHLATRWQVSGICTLIRVKRVRRQFDGSQPQEEVRYFLSNYPAQSQQQADELFNAIRGHWRIETMHYQRDVTLQEDRLRSTNGALSRTMSSLRTLTINLLKRTKEKNMAAQIDQFADNFNALMLFMTQQRVL
jgi:predicted transposase YbfD/YdcC